MKRAFSCMSLVLLGFSMFSAFGDEGKARSNVKPPFLGDITATVYDGTSDDLLTAGLGWNGLMSSTLPEVSATPTSAQIRRLAIYSNYRALVDMTKEGGYGVLYGPNVSPQGVVDTTPGAGKIAGTELIAYSLNESGRPAATLMVQIPANFNEKEPCIVTATSSGSRGVYGAIAAVGEWGLKHGCAVAYTDKGTGNGADELGTSTVILMNGLTANATSAGNGSLFTANLTDADRAAFNTANPYRYAFKHAHSQQNPEKDWGRFTLQAVEFALYAINERGAPTVAGTNQKERRFRAESTLVIAASVSNGGGAALAAAEQDTKGLIDGVVVGEPQINLNLPAGLKVTRGGMPVPSFGKLLFDYITIANLMQPCAAYSLANTCSPLLATVNPTAAQNRGKALAAHGLIGGSTFTEQADSALKALHDAGWEPDSDLLHASHFGLQATTGVAVTFANAYARASVAAKLCGYSFATTDGVPTSPTFGRPAAAAISPMALLFGTGNGVPPTSGINLVYESQTGPILHTLADGDFGFKGALQLRELWTASGMPADAVKKSVDEARLSGDLHGKPAILLHGRSDALVPVNHTSRPYFGMNKMAEGRASRLRYFEVENAQHFDTFLATPTFNQRFVPLHYYNLKALDLMWTHLHKGTQLPPSQVVRTTPRGRFAPPIAVGTNLKPIALVPSPIDVILFEPLSNTVQVPD